MAWKLDPKSVERIRKIDLDDVSTCIDKTMDITFKLITLGIVLALGAAFFSRIKPAE